MKDVTGKSGVGKRVLDENGNWIAVSSLPKEIQEEIKENSKQAARDMRLQASNQAVELKKLREERDKLEGQNESLQDAVKKQGEQIEKLLAKLDEKPVNKPVKKAPTKKKSEAKSSEVEL